MKEKRLNLNFDFKGFTLREQERFLKELIDLLRRHNFNETITEIVSLEVGYG